MFLEECFLIIAKIFPFGPFWRKSYCIQPPFTSKAHLRALAEIAEDVQIAVSVVIFRADRKIQTGRPGL